MNNNQLILIVDDEEDLCEILRFNFEAEGFKAETAPSAEIALEMMNDKHYDIILLDVMMEQMSGYEMVRQMRLSGDNTPVIFLTARNSHDDQLQGFNNGADDYITKPFSFDTVLARVKAVLRRSSNHHLITSDSAFGLTKREYLIYQLLADNPGQYFSREAILKAVWPDDTLVGERSVDVHITRLRKKLADTGIKIVNKTGFGYGLV